MLSLFDFPLPTVSANGSRIFGCCCCSDFNAELDDVDANVGTLEFRVIPACAFACWFTAPSRRPREFKEALCAPLTSFSSRSFAGGVSCGGFILGRASEVPASGTPSDPAVAPGRDALPSATSLQLRHVAFFPFLISQ